MSQPGPRKPPPKDPELDAAVLRVPYWRALGLGTGIAVLLLPMLWYLATVRGRGGSGIEADWLDGSEWRIVEVDRKTLAKEGVVTFSQGMMRVATRDCSDLTLKYALTAAGISFDQTWLKQPLKPCDEPPRDLVWQRLHEVAGVTRYGTGLALTDKDGRSLIRMRR
ncbi:MAG: hypothetical protein ACKVP7_23660 [Hyphomicrobiaceae bacterium]